MFVEYPMPMSTAGKESGMERPEQLKSHTYSCVLCERVGSGQLRLADGGIALRGPNNLKEKQKSDNEQHANRILQTAVG